MAARPLPDVASRTLTISPTGTVDSHAYTRVGPQDSICFENTAAFPVNIVFTDVFGEIDNLQPNTTSPEQGGTSSLNVTINYTIYNANSGEQTGGPYAVQFGNGPITVTISALNTSPDPIAIPAGGKIEFNSDAQYNISWKFSNGQPAHNVWAPQPPQVSHGANPAQGASGTANGQTLTYTISNTAATSGGGTVKVGS